MFPDTIKCNRKREPQYFSTILSSFRATLCNSSIDTYAIPNSNQPITDVDKSTVCKIGFINVVQTNSRKAICYYYFEFLMKLIYFPDHIGESEIDLKLLGISFSIQRFRPKLIKTLKAQPLQKLIFLSTFAGWSWLAGRAWHNWITIKITPVPERRVNRRFNKSQPWPPLMCVCFLSQTTYLGTLK